MIPTYHESCIATWLNSLDLSETEEDSLASETVSEDIAVTPYAIKCPRKKTVRQELWAVRGKPLTRISYLLKWFMKTHLLLITLLMSEGTARV